MAHYCYALQSTAEIVSYIHKIDVLITELLAYQNINIHVENDEELWNRNYDPDMIDAKTTKFKHNLVEQIKVKFTEPFRSWNKSLISVIETPSSLKAIRGAVRDFTNISPDQKERRQSTAEFTFMATKSFKEVLPLLHEQLIRNNLIIKDTSLLLLKQAFSGNPKLSKQIVWTGTIVNLRKLVELLIEKNYIHTPTFVWATTANIFFKAEANDLHQSLGHNHKSLKPSVKIDNIAKALKPHKSLN